MKKKSLSALTVIAGAALLLIVFVVILLIFRTYIGRESGIIGEQIDSLGDCDCDDVRNFLDKCPCDIAEEGSKLTGCPASALEPIPCNKERCEATKLSSALCIKKK